MKIGIMADSHDNLPVIRRALELFRDEGAECVVHAGDFIAPFAVHEILKFDGAVMGCFGNNDGERDGILKVWPEIVNPPRTLELGGRRILLTHDLNQPYADLLESADLLVCGHTHEPAISDVNGKLCINPGETGGWLHDRSTVAMLDTETLEARIMEL